MSKDIEETMDVKEEKTKKELYDEAQAKKRAERARKEAKALRKAEKEALKKKYHNPAYSTAGKIMIWILVVAMVAVIFISLIYLIIQNVK